MAEPNQSELRTDRNFVDPARVRQLLLYDPAAGSFTWRQGSKVGLIAGGASDQRYRRIRIDGVSIYEHRLAFLYMTGDCPQYIDHVDLDKCNNKWVNLRASDKSTNGQNRAPTVRNTCGHKGVRWDEARGKWSARITARGVTYPLGRHIRLEDAAAAYEAKAKELFGAFARS